MIRINEIYLPLGYSESDIISRTAKLLGIKVGDISAIKLVKRSVDARKKNDVHFTASVEIETKYEKQLLKKFPPNKVSPAKKIVYIPKTPKNRKHRPVVVGFGPAGMFAALCLAESGLKPVVLERGSDADKRTEAVENFRINGILSEAANVQFGEGGAGTFSDGKLTTGIKDERITHVFETLVRFGAPQEILYSARPHIGTDILRNVVKNIRAEIIRLGGTVIFEAKFTEITAKNGSVCGAVYEKDGQQHEIPADSIILAAGHSARDTFKMLYGAKLPLAQKSFAMGVRIEHLQSDVNKSLYGSFAGNKYLPPADYKYAVHLPNGRSLFTFCMCPGGYVMAAASEKETVVTNGMSLFARDGVNANAALLVNTDPADFGSEYELAGAELQQKIERAAFIAGGGNYGAPIQLVDDLIRRQNSTSLGSVIPTYQPSVRFAETESYLPEFISETLRLGIPEIAKKADFFNKGDAVLTGPETRSSSPVRILRNEKLMSPALKGFYPCGEGAGYAGGIVSAAVDGIKCSEAVIENG